MCHNGDRKYEYENNNFVLKFRLLRKTLTKLQYFKGYKGSYHYMQYHYNNWGIFIVGHRKNKIEILVILKAVKRKTFIKKKYYVMHLQNNSKMTIL